MRKLSKQWGVICVLATGICLLLASAQAAAETGTWKGRDVQVEVKAEAIEVPDVPGHFIGVEEVAGLSTNVDTGEVAWHIIRGTFDGINGSGSHQGYTTYTYEDGSTITYKYQGTHQPGPEGKGMSFEGKSTIVNGTGRFAGIEGESAYKGGKPPGASRWAYVDWTCTYTLPEK